MEKQKPHFETVAPIFPVTNLKASVRYYTEKLLFKIGFEWANAEDEAVSYAIVQKDDTELHLTQSPKPHKTRAYFFVSGVQDYYNAIQNTEATITYKIQDLPWEMREFEVSDPDGNLIIFGEHLSNINPDQES